MYPYQDSKLTPCERTRDLLSRMTVEEKIGQLVKLDGFKSYVRNGNDYHLTDEFLKTIEKYPIGSMYGAIRADWWTQRDHDNGVPPENMSKLVNLFRSSVRKASRWGIPLYIAEEAPHGLMALGGTVFPTGLGLGAMFDKELMLRIGKIIGNEAHASGVQTVYSPIIDIPQDCRWSRTEEDFSEDPYLVSVYGEAMVHGLVSEGTVSTLKHFVAHGSPEGGHNHGASHVGPVEFRNLQLCPFRKAIAAGAKSVMSAYNPVDGEPSSGSHYLLTDILRGELGFDGFVVADRTAIRKLWRSDRVAIDYADASAQAIKAGCDVDEGDLEGHAGGLTDALQRGFISVEDLDRAAGRILKLKFELGLFDQEESFSAPEQIGCAEHRAVALEAARKSMTLLKNSGILPLKQIQSIAVIGPNADNVMNQLGDYTAPQKRSDVQTVLDGIREKCVARGIALHYAPGCRIRKKDTFGFAEAIAAAELADVIVFVPGGSSTKYGSSEVRSATGAAIVSQILDSDECDKESGEGTDRATFCYMGVQMELFRALKALGKPIVVVPVLGRPLLSGEFLADADALLFAWYPGMCGGQAVAEVLFGEYNPAGRLPVSLPRSEGQLPIYYNTHILPRGNYIDMSGEAQLPFGFGLSYTEFSYSNLRMNGRLVSVNVTNIGACAGDEVVEFYLTCLRTPVTRPCLELCGFERIPIAPKETRTVQIELPDEVLGMYDRNGTFTVGKGPYRISVGGSLEKLIALEFSL